MAKKQVISTNGRHACDRRNVKRIFMKQIFQTFGLIYSAMLSVAQNYRKLND
jgi:hypothetical protein